MGLDASADSAAVSQAVETKFSEEINTVISYLLVDCPYDLYWYDKTALTPYSYSPSYNMNTVTIKVLNIYFPVISTYQISGYNSNNPMIDTTKTSVPTNAAANAQSIVAKHADEETITRLTNYKDEICDLVSYNSDAASSSYTDGYGDPWQLVYVFDEDPDTSVVCEGYSKAFQYLCDLDGGDEVCYLVTGTMSGGTGAGPHMWDIVRIDGTNYLVDVTNSDSGTVGQNGGLFLVTGSNAAHIAYDGKGVPSYTFLVSGTNVSYVYDEDTVALFPLSVLTLETSAPEDLSEYDIILSEKKYTYDGTAKEPAVTITHEIATLVLDEDYRVSYSDNIKAGTAKVIITGIGDYTGEETATFEIIPADISSADLKLSETKFTYDGTAKEPVVTVTYNGTTLQEGTDYTVSYNDNTNAGTATVSLTGIGNYTGTLSSEFTIAKAEQNITAEIDSDSIVFGETTFITANADYTDQLSYVSSDTSVVTVDENGIVTAVGTGTAAITVTVGESDNYNEGSATFEITVDPLDIEKANGTINLSENSYTYNGSAKEPEATVTVDGDILMEEIDYMVSYEDNVDAGTATVTVTGIGNYSGSLSETFEIEKADLANASVSFSETSYVYDGTEKIPEITITLLNGTVLVQDRDYEVSFGEDIINAGIVEVTVTGTGDNYTGSQTCTYTIEKAAQAISFEEETISKLENAHPFINELTVGFISEEEGAGITYTSSDPSVAVVDETSGEVVINGVGTVTITATASETKNYVSATTSYELTITRPEGIVESNIGDGEYVYDGKTIYLYAKITHESAGDADDVQYTYQWYRGDELLEDEAGDTLELSGENVGVQTGTVYTCVITMTSGSHYTEEITASFTVTIQQAKNNLTFLTESLDKTYDGAAVEVPGIEADFGADTAVITWYELNADGEVIGDALNTAPVDAGMYKVAALIAETDNYAEAVAELVFEINPQTITEEMFTVDTGAEEYNGSAIVKDVSSNAGLIEGKDYSISYTDNTNTGKATITITGIGNYTGTVKFTFEITEPETKTDESETGGTGTVEKEQETEALTEEEADLQTLSVQTGDTTPLMPVTMMLLAVGICFVLLLMQRRGREEK